MKRVMKRALADRAKKLDLPQTETPVGAAGGAGSPSMISNKNSEGATNGRISFVSSPPEGQPPLKIPRIALQEESSLIRENPPSASTSSAPPPVTVAAPPATTVLQRGESSASIGSAGIPPSSPRLTGPKPESSRSGGNSQSNSATSSLKRPRRETSTNLSQSVSEQDNDSSSAFYLQHQNRALAVELKSLQAQVRELAQEREFRRKSCLQALQALHSLQATWTSLETALGQGSLSTPASNAQASPDMPSSTTGNSDETAVEWTAALHRALQTLGNQRRTVSNENGNNDATETNDMEGGGGGYAGEMMNLGEMAANITGRATCLQEWLWEVLRSKNWQAPSLDEMKQLRKDFCEVQQLQAQVTELMDSRDDLGSKERRLRRNIYRLDVGMITQKQLIQSVVAGTLNVDEDPERLAVQKEAVLTGALGGNKPDEKQEDDSAKNDSERDSVSAKVVLDLQRELEDSRHEVTNREKSIEEMSGRIRDLELRVNELSVKQQSDEDKGKLESYESMSQKLQVAERDAKDLTRRLETTREKWAQSAGNEKALLKALEDLQEKHQKRWTELTATEESAQENGGITSSEEQARKIVELEHKLRQALENVRQAEAVRSNLRDALMMNESLQTTVAELKEKFEALQAEKNEKAEKGDRSASKPSSSGDQPQTTSSTSIKTEGQNESKSHHHHHRESGGSDRISAEKAEKLYRENKKMRKEMVAIIASKEGHKAKLERVEKERNGLVDVNARLLKQATEKDEMNAKSLSSILHLKSLTEQLTQERENLEQQMKSAEQLALAARLATNAKERLGEELVREKTSVEEELKELEKLHGETKNELSQKTVEFSDASGKTATLNTELANALKRCNEFVTQAEEQSGEIRKLLDALEKAERQAKEAREKLAELSKSSAGSGNSSFTTDQLQTQVQVLKNRLACPVCHYRDKECIIMRCRHMHCKQCVEERLANRSRRCPTCNNPFGRSDLEDIFLG